MIVSIKVVNFSISVSLMLPFEIQVLVVVVGVMSLGGDICCW